MYVGRDFDISDTGENEVYTLDFVNDLVAGEAIASAVWSCAALSGVDPSPASRLSGAAMISGTQTSQRVAGLLPGVRYRLMAQVTTSTGNVKSLWSHVTSRGPD